jgi:hypothetical protein
MIKRRSAFIALGQPPPVDVYILEYTIQNVLECSRAFYRALEGCGTFNL